VARLTAQEHLLGCLLCEPGLYLRLKDEEWEAVVPEAFPEGPARRIAEAMADLRLNEEAATLRAVMVSIEDAATQRFATHAAAEVDRMTEGDGQRLVQHFAERVREVLLRRTEGQGQEEAKGDWIHAVLRQRELRAAMGHDPTRLPRPSG